MRFLCSLPAVNSSDAACLLTTAVDYPAPPFLHTIAPFSENDLTDVVDLPAGVTSYQVSQYVATHRDVQTAADITDQQ